MPLMQAVLTTSTTPSFALEHSPVAAWGQVTPVGNPKLRPKEAAEDRWGSPEKLGAGTCSGCSDPSSMPSTKQSTRSDPNA